MYPALARGCADAVSPRSAPTVRKPSQPLSLPESDDGFTPANDGEIVLTMDEIRSMIEAEVPLEILQIELTTESRPWLEAVVGPAAGAPAPVEAGEEEAARPCARYPVCLARIVFSMKPNLEPL